MAKLRTLSGQDLLRTFSKFGFEKFGSSGESVGGRGLSLALSEEVVEFPAGGVEGALVLFRAVMNEGSAILMDHAM